MPEPADEPPVPTELLEPFRFEAVELPTPVVEAELVPEPGFAPAAEPPVPTEELLVPLPAVVLPVPRVDAEPEPDEPPLAADPPVPTEVLVDPLPAVVLPRPRVDAEPEPEPPAEEPPVPIEVLADPAPAVEPPAPIVELDCASAAAEVPASNAAARAILQRWFAIIFLLDVVRRTNRTGKNGIRSGNFTFWYRSTHHLPGERNHEIALFINAPGYVPSGVAEITERTSVY